MKRHKGFLNVSTGQPASCDTEVSLAREGDALVVRARCHCDAAGVSAHDRLVISSDPVGREADIRAPASFRLIIPRRPIR
jgi:hypothetical protein